jgi:hypothetical protein
MKPNFRVLSFVLFLVIILATAVTLVHLPLIGFSERIHLPNTSFSVQQKTGLLLRLNEEGLSISVPNCDMNSFHDRFFMHVYPISRSGDAAQNFINRDFDLRQEKSIRTSLESGVQCVVNRAFGTPYPKEVVIGQFKMPAGRCCEIIWSRSYVFDN